LAPEGWTFADLIAAGWTPEDVEWEAEAEAAIAALAVGDGADAAERFARMVRLARENFPANDPRLATSLASHGASLAAAGQVTAGGVCLREARRLWRDCDGWIARMAPPRAARSSLFHMRMEQRHRAEYDERWRSRWAMLAAEARERVGQDGSPGLIPAAEAAERLARWRRERPAVLDDARKLIAAVVLLACRPDRSPDGAKRNPGPRAA
jgi:hypothetical protein